MAKVTVKVFGIEITVEDNEIPFNTLLGTVSQGVLFLMEQESIKNAFKLALYDKNDDGTDEDGKIPPNNTDKGMFV